MLNSDVIFRSAAALLAFVIAFYTLMARERKAPYAIKSAYPIFFVVLICLILTLVAELLKDFSLKTPSEFTNYAAAALLVGAIVYVYKKIWIELNRHVHFRDDKLLRNTRVWRWLAHFKRRQSSQKRYETNPLRLPPDLIKELEADALWKHHLPSAREHNRGDIFSLSAVCIAPTLIRADQLLIGIASLFLKHNCYVQYTAFSRHPREFLTRLKQNWQSQGQEWNAVQERLVLVDAYTPHFGFSDSVYRTIADEVQPECLEMVTSRASYAGVHTAIARAFNTIKAKTHQSNPGQQSRPPTLVIYDGPQCLTDLESNEQYRIFLRHVIPSERLWGGMFTLFVESSAAGENMAVLRSCGDLFIDLSNENSSSPNKAS